MIIKHLILTKIRLDSFKTYNAANLHAYNWPMVCVCVALPVERQKVSSLSNEQLSLPIFQSLANSMASFFYQKIVPLEYSIASKLYGSPTPFDFDPPHSGEVLSDFTPVTPVEVSQLLRSMSNKSSFLDYIQTSLLKSYADTLFILISH